MRTEQAARLLARTQLFAGVDEGSVAAIAAEGRERAYKRGAPIFFQGDPGDTFYVVADGTVKVFLTSESGDELLLATVRSPETLGDVSLFDDGPRSASAEALEPAQLLAFPRSTVLDLARRDRRIAESLLRNAGAMLRRLTMQTADLVFLDLEGRVAKLLVEAAERRGHDDGGATRLDLGLTQSELASMVGGSRQSVNQILRALAARGFLTLDGKAVLIADPAALRRRAGLS